MAVYVCDECGEYIDNDYDPMEEVGSQLVCTACAVELHEVDTED